MSLTQDYTTVPGQLFACLSIVGPDTPQKTDKYGVKIRGAFSPVMRLLTTPSDFRLRIPLLISMS